MKVTQNCHKKGMALLAALVDLKTQMKADVSFTKCQKKWEMLITAGGISNRLLNQGRIIYLFICY